MNTPELISEEGEGLEGDCVAGRGVPGDVTFRPFLLSLLGITTTPLSEYISFEFLNISSLFNNKAPQGRGMLTECDR